MTTKNLSSLAVALAAFAMACADAPTSTVPFSPSLHVIPIATPELEQLILCKAGPEGTYTFDATSGDAVLLDEGTGAHDLTAATYTIVVGPGSTINVDGAIIPGACFDFQGHNHIALEGATNAATVTVVEDESANPSGVVFDHVVVYQRNGATVTATSSTTNSASGQVGGNGVAATLGASITFYNVAEQRGSEGCTPGYWKQPHHADSWTTYAPGDDFDTVFGVDLFNPDITLLEALGLNGGGKNALARHAVAALLNAASGDVDYPMTTAEVIAAVAGATPATYESVKNTFATNNELGCPLN